MLYILLALPDHDSRSTWPRAAGASSTELRQVRDVLGMSAAQQEMFKQQRVPGLARRGGRPARDHRLHLVRRRSHSGIGGAETVARTALMIVDIYQGDYEAAYQIAQHGTGI